MSVSLMSWNSVWRRHQDPSSYSYLESRMERSLDKIGYYLQRGISFKPGEKVLEAGCGDGLILLNLIRHFSIKGYGVDFSTDALEHARRLFQARHVPAELIQADIRTMPFPDNYFDKVVSLGVIEHLEDPKQALQELARVLKPGGVAIIMTPNKLSLGFFDRLYQEATAQWAFGYQREFTPSDLRTMALDSGFTYATSESALRRSLPNDNTTFKWISRFDQVANTLIPNWGFYSYLYAGKSGENV
jgi:ubiquinone/menaquinone biosynthesis C-methylase UbiE